MHCCLLIFRPHVSVGSRVDRNSWSIVCHVDSALGRVDYQGRPIVRYLTILWPKSCVCRWSTDMVNRPSVRVGLSCLVWPPGSIMHSVDFWICAGTFWFLLIIFINLHNTFLQWYNRSWSLTCLSFFHSLTTKDDQSSVGSSALSLLHVERSI